jgi:hypothetical protein
MHDVLVPLRARAAVVDGVVADELQVGAELLVRGVGVLVHLEADLVEKHRLGDDVRVIRVVVKVHHLAEVLVLGVLGQLVQGLAEKLPQLAQVVLVTLVLLPQQRQVAQRGFSWRGRRCDG